MLESRPWSKQFQSCENTFNISFIFFQRDILIVSINEFILQNYRKANKAILFRPKPFSFDWPVTMKVELSFEIQIADAFLMRLTMIIFHSFFQGTARTASALLSDILHP